MYGIIVYLVSPLFAPRATRWPGGELCGARAPGGRAPARAARRSPVYCKTF